MRKESDNGTSPIIRKVKKVPVYGEKGTGNVSPVQEALAERGYYKGTIDDWFLTETKKSLIEFQKAKGLTGTGVIPEDGGETFRHLCIEIEKATETPGVPAKPSENGWGREMEKMEGKKESDSAFSKYLSGFWKYVGLSFTTIVGSSRAWCGLIIAVVLILSGYGYQKNGAGAKNWDVYGQAVHWQENGIPKDAIVRINHNGDCGAGSGNHVTLMAGDCKASDVIEMVKNSKGVYVAKAKAGATIPGRGGNQGNQVKVSWYPVKNICAVRWPLKKADGTPVALPPPVQKSNGCNGKPASKESTQ